MNTAPADETVKKRLVQVENHNGNTIGSRTYGTL